MFYDIQVFVNTSGSLLSLTVLIPPPKQFISTITRAQYLQCILDVKGRDKRLAQLTDACDRILIPIK